MKIMWQRWQPNKRDRFSLWCTEWKTVWRDCTQCSTQ